MAAIATNLGAIGVDSAGAGAAVPILFLHGVGSDKSVWRPQLDHFGRSRRAIALDYPGYGESDLAAGADREHFAAAMLAAMDALAIPSAHVCGLSLGGVIAIAMHAAAPQRIATLTLADSFAVHPEGPAIYRRSIDASEELGMAGLAEARVDALIAPAAGRAIRAEVVATMSAIDPAAYRIGAAAVWLADQRRRAAAVDVPTLVLVGSDDRITPPALSADLAEIIPGARLLEIAGAGHLANLEKPAEFNRAIDEFLSETEHLRLG